MASSDKHYFLDVNGHGKAASYRYLTITAEGGWYESRMGTPDYEAIPAPEGMSEALNMWFRVNFQFAGLNIRNFMRQLGVKL